MDQQAPGVGHNRPPRPEAPQRPPEPMGPPRRVRDVLKNMAAHWITSIEDNEKLSPCCSKPRENSTVQFFRTPTAPKDGKPDLLIIQCQRCSRRQYRLQCGTMKIGSEVIGQ